MRYADKDTLADTDWSIVTAFLFQAVYAVHKKQIIHRDLKPANFALVGGHVKLIDFGLAKTLPQNTETMSCGEVSLAVAALLRAY